LSDNIEAGWYLVELHHPAPQKGYVKMYTEWVEYTDEGWDMDEIEEMTVGKIIQKDHGLS